MKIKILSTIIAIATAFSLAACGEKEESSAKPNDKPTASSSEPASSSGSASESAPPASAPTDPSRPKLVESRIYVAQDNPSDNYRVDIYDNGGWEISQEHGNMQYYAGYSYADEAAGVYTTIQCYNLAFEPPQHSAAGNARFEMNESTLTLWYANGTGEGEVYYRHPIDEPLY